VFQVLGKVVVLGELWEGNILVAFVRNHDMHRWLHWRATSAQKWQSEMIRIKKTRLGNAVGRLQDDDADPILLLYSERSTGKTRVHNTLLFAVYNWLVLTRDIQEEPPCLCP